ncbi:MFS transporter [Aphanothece hegewaldii CCALA 016]|uniref:MFS transporter n=2 Tax=Aphanothece TaxID=1121 RepID=A0A2T1LRE3_9CHRO|nr:MFS transporter [Aphanothece hegewaldii CCALA 016]
MNRFTLLQSLRNPVFARLYSAQTVSLLGDALTWVGLALLAFELAGKNSAVVLSGALTLRVTAFVLLSPLAGAIADRLDRKTIMVTTHLIRMLIVSLLPFVAEVWQIYLLVFALNIFNAFFTPTYQATIPLVTGQQDYPQAIALSAATYQLLGVLGPGIAGSIAALIGARQVFFLDGLTFFIAAILIFTLPGHLRVEANQDSSLSKGKTWQDIKQGTSRLFSDAPIRYALAMQLVAAIAGAAILVNTVGYVKGTLKLQSVEYGWVMAAFGIGATLSAMAIGVLNQRYQRTTFVLFGAILITLSLLPANYFGLMPLMFLWLLAGAGQTCVNLPTQTLIADRVPTNVQGRVYGAHFAWSHLWWTIAYPLAGWLGKYWSDRSFLYSSLVGLSLLGIVQIFLSPGREYIWHDHEHIHDEYHQHEHDDGVQERELHSHPHRHIIPHHHYHNPY